MEMAWANIKIRLFFGFTSLAERSIGAGPPVIIQLSDQNPPRISKCSPGIQHYHVSKTKQYGWLIYSWIINAFEIVTWDNIDIIIVFYITKYWYSLQ
jgi:hypothetical protein